MNSLVGRDYFEILEQKQAELFAGKKVRAAMQVARLLYAQAPRDYAQRGVAARTIAAGHNTFREHRDAWHWATKAWYAHDEQLHAPNSELHILGERAVSGAYAAAMGLLFALHEEREDKNMNETGEEALSYARTSLQDFGIYRTRNDDQPHPLELLSLSRISMTESIYGDEEQGRRLAHMAFDLVELAEGWLDGEDREMRQERAGAFGALIVASTHGLLRVGDNLYEAVYEVV